MAIDIQLQMEKIRKKQIMLKYYREIMPKNIIQVALDMDVKKIESYSQEDRTAAIITLANDAYNFKNLILDVNEGKYGYPTKDKVAKLNKQIAELKAINSDLEKQLKDKYPGGRKPKYTDEFKEEVRRFYAAGGQTHKSVAAHFGIGTTTVNRILNNH